MTSPLADLRRSDAHARWRVADALALRPEAASHLAVTPVHLAGWMEDDDEEDDAPVYEVVNGVAIVPVYGALMDRSCWCWDGYDSITARIEAAHADPAARAIMLDLDSPGGMVAGLFDCMRALRAAKASSKKRMVAWVASGAYSAAYGIASTCDEIVTSDTAGTGSVGVITSLISRVDQLAQDGIDVRVVSSGVEKTDGHPAVAISPAAEARTSARVRELAAMFFAEVGAGRSGLSADVLTALDGGVRYGRAAVAAGLADRISTRAALLSDLQAAAAARPIAPARGTTTGASRATRNTMNEEHLAALVAATGESDPAKLAAAVVTLKTRCDGAEASLARLTSDHAAALDRAQAAEARADAMERTAEIEAAKAAGQWTPALEGFLGTLSVPQVRAWRATAPRAVPEGEVRPPVETARGGSNGSPSEAVAAAIAKAEAQGWASLSGGEKAVVARHSKTIADRLRASR